jgi:hypothetical protein
MTWMPPLQGRRGAPHHFSKRKALPEKVRGQLQVVETLPKLGPP